MARHIHILDRNIHREFLSQNQHDLLTRDKFRHGDRVVACASCKIVSLLETWELHCGCPHCKGYIELDHIPISNREVRVSPPSLHKKITAKFSLLSKKLKLILSHIKDVQIFILTHKKKILLSLVCVFLVSFLFKKNPPMSQNAVNESAKSKNYSRLSVCSVSEGVFCLNYPTITGLNLRSGPGLQYSSIKVLNEYSKLYYQKESSGHNMQTLWVKVKDETGSVGWVKFCKLKTSKPELSKSCESS